MKNELLNWGKEKIILSNHAEYFIKLHNAIRQVHLNKVERKDYIVQSLIDFIKPNRPCHNTGYHFSSTYFVQSTYPRPF